MPDQKARVGYITFEGLDGPRRLFYFDEPLALGLLCVLERAARSAGGDGTSGELDPTVHNVAALEAHRRERERQDAAIASAKRAYLETLAAELRAGVR